MFILNFIINLDVFIDKIYLQTQIKQNLLKLNVTGNYLLLHINELYSQNLFSLLIVIVNNLYYFSFEFLLYLLVADILVRP